MIYFLVTTSLYNNSEIRKEQYVRGITKLLEETTTLDNYKIIIIENNGCKSTFLDNFNCDVFYTNNNFLNTGYGNKELLDIQQCISHYNILDDDFVVKMTGRYYLDENSNFINMLKTLNKTNYDAILRYGPYYASVNYYVDDCITGLIGMKCKYVKLIKKHDINKCIEWNWALVTKCIDNDKVCILNCMGINICPGSNSYFKV